jgi:hypothetical protein
MVKGWFASRGDSAPETVADLLVRKDFERAVQLAEELLADRPREERLRLQYVDALVGARRIPQAVNVLSDLADELAADGFAVKAIAALKRIQRISPGRSAIDKRLADLIKKSAGARERPAAMAPRQEMVFGIEEIPDPRVAALPNAAAAIPASTWDPSAPPPADADDLGLPGPVAAAVPPASAAEQAEAGPPAPRRVPRTPLFDALSADELAAFISGLELLFYSPGDVIVAQGAPGESLFIVTTGHVKAWMRNSEGHYVKMREMGEGDFFGEISILSGRPRTATITAGGYCELLELDRRSLERITASHPHVLEVMRQVYEQRVVESA